MDWFQIGKGVCQGCVLSPYLFNSSTEYIVQNAGMDETQAGNKVSGRNINSLRYSHDTTIIAENEEELKSILMKMKKETEETSLNSTFKTRRSCHLGPSLHSK